MQDSINNTFIALEKAVEAAGMVLDLVEAAPTQLKSLADQAVRAAVSVPANIAEGNGKTGRARSHSFGIALAEAREIDPHLRLLSRSRHVNRALAAKAISRFDEVRAMVWRLMHPRR